MIGTLAMALGSAALQGGSSYLSSAFQYNMQKKLDRKAFRRQVLLMRMQQQWSERMANTAHQREVKDLRAAGLNPILSAGGQGAMTPAVGSSAVSTGSRVEAPETPEIDLLDDMHTSSATDLNEANTKKASVEAQLNRELAETERLRQKQIRAQTDKTKAETAGVHHTNKTKEATGTASGVFNSIIDQYSDLFGTAKSRRQVIEGFSGSHYPRPTVDNKKPVRRQYRVLFPFPARWFERRPGPTRMVAPFAPRVPAAGKGNYPLELHRRYRHHIDRNRSPGGWYK